MAVLFFCASESRTYFFLVPGMSLGAELSDDYEERTSITSYRVMFSSLVGPFLLMFGLLVFFKPTEQYTNGLFNEAAYQNFTIMWNSCSPSDSYKYLWHSVYHSIIT